MLDVRFHTIAVTLLGALNRDQKLRAPVLRRRARQIEGRTSRSSHSPIDTQGASTAPAEARRSSRFDSQA